MDWKVDITELLTLLGKTIYRPENVLVELAANSYDADASRVEVTSSGESRMIQMKDDGCGMALSDLDELITVDPTAEYHQHYGHQKEVHITTQDMHNERLTRILRVYVISEIVAEIAREQS